MTVDVFSVPATDMKPLMLAVLAAYVVAAIHSVLAFVNKRRSLERISIEALAAGFVLHSIALFIDWTGGTEYSLFYLRETLSFLAWTLVATYGLVSYRYATSALGTFTLPLVVVMIFVANLIHAGTGEVPRDVVFLRETWLFPVHTTLLLFAYASFFVVFVASVMYLVQERELKSKTFGAIFHRLPSLATINQIATSAAATGLTLLTLGILAGMLWSSSRDGRLWHNDPKEIFAFLTWLLYLFLILYRSSALWRGRKAAWMGVAGFVLVLCTFLGARLMGGYHVFS
jgi:ABC-type uncharacterized transport system permease subunit